MQCYSCSSYIAGYHTNSEGQCEEICGDGLHLGSYECDDGNTQNGDGCSSQCKIEENYKCVLSSATSTSLCTNAQPPTARIAFVTKQNSITIKFSKGVQSYEMDKDLLEKKLTVTLKNAEKDCNLVWKVTSKYEKAFTITSLDISTTIYCDILNNKEILVITFPQDYPFVDRNKNVLSTTELTTGLKKSRYISSESLAVLSNSGSIVKTCSLLTLLIAILPSLFMSSAITQFWAFVNVVQLILYIPLMDIQIPNNFYYFITEYLSLANFGIPSELFPSWMPNLSQSLQDFLTQPQNPNIDL